MPFTSSGNPKPEQKVRPTIATVKRNVEHDNSESESDDVPMQVDGASDREESSKKKKISNQNSDSEFSVTGMFPSEKDLSMAVLELEDNKRDDTETEGNCEGQSTDGAEMGTSKRTRKRKERTASENDNQ